MKLTSPPVGKRSPFKTFKRVVLPVPLAPRIASVSPGLTVKLKSLRAVTGPYENETPSTL
jgi:hypothetical protein